ncbi:hypothetical protein [Actinoplanes palleronii]|uniref:Uncharacterized protein n=1 Tax=Actinoplanes palleronii TaxID=113570 RepID=A0ABQ4BLF2_9ACTN|nr:hypothetical protein [Actinoplanes palleronii]GIE71510.1 hypothetical protein Apa02nite_076180 [Actinoplanes palleronii]
MTNAAQRIAAIWAAGYGTLALGWTILGRGFPYGPDDTRNTTSALRALDPHVGAPLFAAVLLTAAVALLVASRSDSPARPVRLAVLGYLWPVAIVLLVVVPDVRLLTLLGYLPMLIVGLPFGWPPIDYGQVFTATLGHEALAVLGGLLIARAALRWQRRTAGACETCGRDDTADDWTTPAAAARWGRIAAWTAAVIPALYAAVRLCWAAGLPVGIDAGFLAEMHRTGLVWAGAGLAAFALTGSVLTLGLIQRWGERFPRWVPGLAGRRVPIRLATVPATAVAVLVFSASISLFTGEGSEQLFAGQDLAARLPMTLWPLWGAALGAAAWAYHLRRRPACTVCDKGIDPVAGLVRGSGPEAY